MSDRAARAGVPLLALVVLAAAVAWNPDLGLDPGATDRGASDRLAAVLDALPPQPDVLVGFDPDLGTYPEIRPTVRAVLAELVGRGSRLSFVSLTPEGRALAISEMDRLGRAGATAARPIDLGFLPGAEAALVALAGSLSGTAAGEAGIDGPDPGPSDLLLAIGGNDLGPRSWIEQVAPRVAGLPIVAVTPAVLLPEVEPYRASGQLAALVSTPREGAAYRARAGARDAAGSSELAGPSPLAVALGLLMAVAWLGAGVGAVIAPSLRSRAGAERR